MELDRSSTEEVNPASRGLDAKDTAGILRVIHAEDRSAWEAVGGALFALEALADAAAKRFSRGGRLVYVGAGTSGRLGVLDAAECPPTFGVEASQVVGLIAGGSEALVRAIEGAEDDAPSGAAAVRALEIGPADLVCGIAASGTTPFVLAALAEARAAGAATALLYSNARLGRSDLERVDHPVLLDVGPEVIAGSTRMKCGTATKMALQMLSTTVMVRCGKVYDNLMVDVVASNQKLERRARRLVMQLASVGEERARELLAGAGGRVKVAVVVARTGRDVEGARQLLDENDGSLRRALVASGAAIEDSPEPDPDLRSRDRS